MGRKFSQQGRSRREGGGGGVPSASANFFSVNGQNPTLSAKTLPQRPKPSLDAEHADQRSKPFFLTAHKTLPCHKERNAIHYGAVKIEEEHEGNFLKWRRIHVSQSKFFFSMDIYLHTFCFHFVFFMMYSDYSPLDLKREKCFYENKEFFFFENKRL